MTSMRFMCLVPLGLLAGATHKTISVTKTNTTESISNNVIGSRMSFCLGPGITASSNLYKQDSDVVFNNALKTNDINNNNIKNHDSK